MTRQFSSAVLYFSSDVQGSLCIIHTSSSRKIFLYHSRDLYVEKNIFIFLIITHESIINRHTVVYIINIICTLAHSSLYVLICKHAVHCDLHIRNIHVLVMCMCVCVLGFVTGRKITRADFALSNDFQPSKRLVVVVVVVVDRALDIYIYIMI